MSYKSKWKKKQAQEIIEQVQAMFPTQAHVNAAQNMYGVLDPSQGHGMNNAQWRWMNSAGPGPKEVMHPWQMKPNAFHDMMYTAEDMPQSTHNAMWRDYYTMNNLPPALNNQKNIDILIKAAGLNNNPY